MERREGRRIKRRLTCEFFDGATAQRGIILDISPSGLFIRTNAVIAPGTEIDIHLAASVAAPAMTLRGCVVRRKSVPATLTTLIQPGLGVRIIEAPREFGLLTRDCELEQPIGGDSDANAYGTTPAQAEQRAAAPASEHPASPPHAEQRAAPAQAAARTASGKAPQPLSTPTRDDRPPAARGDESRAPKEARATSKRDSPRAGERSARVEKPRAPRESIAVLVGGSALDDVAEALGSLGVEVVRCGPYDPQLAALDDARLLVVTAEIAVSDPIPVDTEMLVGIAVCGEISETMRSQIRQQGFRYLLRPQVHPEALRLLLRYAVYAERDRRGRVRHPVGCEVSWRIGWKRGRGRLLDISRGGCCLLVDDSPKLGASVAIKLPAELAGDHALKLRGKVLRATPHAAYTGREQTALGIALDDLGAATSKAVAELCERWNESPPMLPRSEWLQLPGSGGRRAAASGKPSAAAREPGSRPGAAATQESAGERSTEAGARSAVPQPAAFETARLTRRGVYDREIVQLDEQARVVQALLGRDLSVDGIRVARQLGLTPGDKLNLALFDASQKEPLMIAAEVCRDDGGSGLFLRFIDASPATCARIEAIVAQLPAVEAIDPHGDASVIPTEVICDPQ